MNKAKTVMGIDPSLTATAVVVLKGDRHKSWLFSSKPSGSLLDKRFARYERLLDKVIDVVEKTGPSLIVIEGVFVGRSTKSTQDIIEYGAILRGGLLGEVQMAVLEVPPKTLKKFIVGNGNAKKLQMATTIVKRWGVEFTTDDEYDAFGLALLGQCMLGEFKGNAKQMEIVEALRSEVC